MRRRSSAGGRSVKRRPRRTIRSKARTTGLAQVSPADWQEQLDRSTRERDEALEQQAATAEVLKVISRSNFDLQSVLDKLTESAARLCEAHMACIVRPHEGRFFFAANYHFPRAFVNLVTGSPVGGGRGTMAGRVLVEGHPIHIPDVLADREYQFSEGQKLAGFHSLLGVPLMRDGVSIGVIVLGRSLVQPFTDKQIELVSTFADQAVIAIENVRLFEAEQQRGRELAESLEQQTATSEVLQAISSSPGELQQVFDTMAESAVRLCQAERAFIFRFDGEFLRPVAYYNVGSELREFVGRNPIPPGRHSISARAALERRTVHIPDVQVDPEYAYAVQDKEPIHTLLAVPMLKVDDLVGIITIYRLKIQPFTDKQVELIEIFADQAVIAIENARLLNELRESLQQQTATADVLKVISRSIFDLQAVLSTLVESAVSLCKADKAQILLPRENEHSFYAVASYGHTPEYNEYLKTLTFTPGREGVVGRVMMERKPVQIDDVLSDPDYTLVETQRLGGFRTHLGLPLLRGPDPIGILILSRATVAPFEDRQIELLTTFADQAVIALENARLLNELRDSLQQQTATADVLKVISRSTFHLTTVLQTLVESAARLCDAEKATITRQKGDLFYRAETYGFSSEFMDSVSNVPVVPDRGSATGRALLEGKVVHIPDVHADSDYTFSEALKHGEFRTILGVPMLREGVPIGVFALTRSEVRPFTDKQIELVSTFADQAAIAIENVRLFERVETRTHELAKSLEDLRTAQDRLVQTEKLASLGQLTAGIAHEIKNPLNFVNNFSGVSVELIDELQEAVASLKADDKPRAQIAELADTLRGNLEKIIQHGKRADSIVKNMLLHSRSGSGDHRSVDINALVEESLNLAYHGARAEQEGFNITLERSFDPAAGEVELFPQEITRVLLNLISNGFYAATKRKGEIGDESCEPALVVATKTLGDRVEIKIRDNGTGIPPDVKGKMFNPFFTTKPAGEGTGLGLSISHDIIVKQHAGSIEVDTETGKFTEFRIVLPRKAVASAKSGGSA
jgi:two-component system, NtrC family, sensor kinase